MKKKNNTPEPSYLSLADVAGLTAAVCCDLYAAAVQVRRRAFVEQGKLVMHLDSIKLPAGKTVYGMLQSRNVPEGSVHQARMAADILKELVIPGHLPEARFNKVITFRIARQGRRLIQGKAKTKLAPEQLAAILSEGNSAAIGAELDCLCEHGMTIADRESAIETEAAEAAALKAAEEQAAKLKAAEAERLAKEQAAEIERLKAAAAANATSSEPETIIITGSAEDPDEEEEEEEETDDTEIEDPSDPSDPSDNPEEDEGEEEEDESDDIEEEDPEEEEEEEESADPAPVITSHKPQDKGNPPPPPPAPSAESITTRIEELLVEALDLGPEEMEKLVHYLRRSTNDLAATLDALKAVA